MHIRKGKANVMDAYNDGRPPYPNDFGATERRAPLGDAAEPQPAYTSYQQVPTNMAPATIVAASAPAPAPARGGWLKSLLFGLIGGAVGAAAIVFALSAFGLLGTSTTKVIQTTESGAGPTISINATTEDATVAKAVAAKALPSVVSVYVSSSEGSGLGSGVILDTDGNIITNYHVVEGADSVSVTLGNGNSYDATVVGTDASSDLAVVHAELDGDEVTPIEIGDSDALVVGDWVMTIGSPFGLDQSVSAGIVSSLSRNQLMQSSAGNTLYTNLIQTDAAINPGNSGGAMVNAEGQLVGIDTLFSSDTESFAGIGFAIPGNYAVEVAKKIIAGEQVTHAYIGLSMMTVNAQNAAANHLSVNQGAYVAEVAEGGPAEAAGLEEGDIIIKLGNQKITSADGMILAVRSYKIGETVTLTYMRGAEEKTCEVTFGDDAELQRQQAEQLQQQQDQSFGMIGDENGYGYGYPDDYGYGYPEGNGYPESNGITYEEFMDWLFNNRGGSFDME